MIGDFDRKLCVRLDFNKLCQDSKIGRYSSLIFKKTRDALAAVYNGITSNFHLVLVMLEALAENRNSIMEGRKVFVFIGPLDAVGNRLVDVGISPKILPNIPRKQISVRNAIHLNKLTGGNGGNYHF